MLRRTDEPNRTTDLRTPFALQGYTNVARLTSAFDVGHYLRLLPLESLTIKGVTCGVTPTLLRAMAAQDSVARQHLKSVYIMPPSSDILLGEFGGNPVITALTAFAHLEDITFHWSSSDFGPLVRLRTLRSLTLSHGNSSLCDALPSMPLLRELSFHAKLFLNFLWRGIRSPSLQHFSFHFENGLELEELADIMNASDVPRLSAIRVEHGCFKGHMSALELTHKLLHGRPDVSLRVWQSLEVTRGFDEFVELCRLMPGITQELRSIVIVDDSEEERQLDEVVPMMVMGLDRMCPNLQSEWVTCPAACICLAVCISLETVPGDTK